MKKKIRTTGICVSSGKVSGTLRMYERGRKYTKKDIVVLDEWLTSGVALLKNAGGILSRQGGITCHASVIAREYGIPCLVAVRGIDEKSIGKPVTLDATQEIITLQ